MTVDALAWVVCGGAVCGGVGLGMAVLLISLWVVYHPHIGRGPWPVPPWWWGDNGPAGQGS